METVSSGWVRLRAAAATRVAALLFAVVLSPASPAHAQVPGFLQVGSRLTWQAGGSSLEGSRLVPNPNGWLWQNGQWNQLESTYGGGGVGYTQVNIVGAGPDGLVGDVRSFLNTDLNAGTFVQSGVDAVVGDLSGLLPYWRSPAQLAALPEGFDGLTSVKRGPRVFGGATYDTISIATMAQGSYTSHVYDAATGLLLFGGSMDAQPGVLTVGPDGAVLQQNRGSVNYTHLLFAGARQLQVPWAGAALPAWLAPGASLAYQGQSRGEMAGSGLPPLPGSALSVGFAFDGAVAGALVGRYWTQLANSAGLPPNQSVTLRAVGSAAFDGPWLPPEGLARLAPGQVLDQDPLTGQVAYFAGVQDGYPAIVVGGSTDDLTQYYDPQTGLMVFSRYRKLAPGIGMQVNEVWYAGQ
ncbi:MAG: hypothetical protein H3C53_03785 [Trueperaceae bacterium]|nr:hypothetical protein [Trueperaceae bacterium]